jgi:hypothetical protein
VLDSDIIKLLGKGQYVTHVISTRGDQILIDSEYPARDKKIEELYPDHDVVDQISIADFKERYLKRIVLPESPPAPAV